MDESKKSYRIDELAERWSCSPRTIMREIERGELAAVKVGSTRRITTAEVIRYQQAHTGAAKPAPAAIAKPLPVKQRSRRAASKSKPSMRRSFVHDQASLSSIIPTDRHRPTRSV